ncbi:hypothetical protein C7999DRAFT_44669 [Corynascus novoguineensis]|uniref:Uncharacterized protein n=1 Tax=Corynascus novoguineensis TaxID=1126955 RepID=A0AAN7HBB9_9PEZI|nr:hypothetical protein C7999DRAFT_44669 [Corynascus novoguineensis]
MDCADMINDKKLRQGFVLATLVSTVAGTFITSINLYDRLIEQRRQKKLDRGQNKRIKELEKRLNEAEEDKKRIKDGAGDAGRASSGDNDFRNTLQQSGNMVQHEYDRYVSNLGPRFAQGDLVAQTQIQSHIILLQGSVIKLLEEALLTGTMPDIHRLYNISEFARDGSIRALRDQYRRMLESVPLQRRPIGPMRRISSTPSLQEHSATPGSSHRRLLQNTATSANGNPLFCICARELQHSNRPLESILVAHKALAVCGACGVGVEVGEEVDGCRSWRIEKEVAVRRLNSARNDRRHSLSGGSESDNIMLRTFLLTQRFIFKCHREKSGYACYLCFLHRDGDTLSTSEEGLVSHITSKHGITEYESDPDIKELNKVLPFR